MRGTAVQARSIEVMREVLTCRVEWVWVRTDGGVDRAMLVAEEVVELVGGRRGTTAAKVTRVVRRVAGRVDYAWVKRAPEVVEVSHDAEGLLRSPCAEWCHHCSAR